MTRPGKIWARRKQESNSWSVALEALRSGERRWTMFRPLMLGMVCVQPDDYCFCFKDNIGETETAEKQDGGRACMDLPERSNAIFSRNWKLKYVYRYSNWCHPSSAETGNWNMSIATVTDVTVLTTQLKHTVFIFSFLFFLCIVYSYTSCSLLMPIAPGGA